jgi:hypothetical protein
LISASGGSKRKKQLAVFLKLGCKERAPLHRFIDHGSVSMEECEYVLHSPTYLRPMPPTLYDKGPKLIRNGEISQTHLVLRSGPSFVLAHEKIDEDALPQPFLKWCMSGDQLGKSISSYAVSVVT